MSGTEAPALAGVAPPEAATRFERGLAALGRAVLEADEPERALRLVCEEAVRLLDARAATVWLHDGTTLAPFRTEPPAAVEADVVLAVPIVGRGGALLGVLSRDAADAPPSALDADRAALVAAIAASAVERLRLAAAVRARDEALQAEQRRKAQFVAMVSHELRTPLNVVLGYADLLLEDVFGSMPDEQRRIVARMHESAKELFELVAATIDIGRLEAGQIPAVPQQLDAAALVRDLQLALARRPSRGVALRWEVAPDLPPLVADPEKLRTVLRNLVANALKFTERGAVVVGVARDGERIAFTVRDTGPGMRPDQLAIIFDMFRQLEPPDTRRHGGLGLGLWVVRRLVDDLRGDIVVESEPGVGSCFRVTLPLRPAL